MLKGIGVVVFPFAVMGLIGLVLELHCLSMVGIDFERVRSVLIGSYRTIIKLHVSIYVLVLTNTYMYTLVMMF